MRTLLLLAIAGCAAAPRAVPREDVAAPLAALAAPDALKGFDWTPDVAASRAETIFANVRVLGDVRADRLMMAMNATKPSLGVACDHCHDTARYPADDKGAKWTARRMLLMTRDLDDRTFGGRTRVTCFTCHRGELRPPSAPEGFAETLAAQPPHPALALPADGERRRASKVYRNLQVLGGRMAPGLGRAMLAFNVVLGVSCGHCHDEKDWASDAKPAKQRAREMLRMVARAGGYIGPRAEISCWTCHRGKLDVPQR